MGGIDDHRGALLHRCDQPLLEPLLDVSPGPLHGGIAKHLSSDRVRGQDQRRGLSRS